MEQIIAPIYEGILKGDMKSVKESVKHALGEHISPDTILKEGFIAAMAEVGHKFEIGEYYVPELLISARAMQSGLEILKPLLVASDVKPAGKIAIGSVKGDMHDIGKNLVGMMLEGAGFDILDLGVDVSPDQFVECVKTEGVDIIAMSALLTTTMLNMKVTIDGIKAAGLAGSVKVIIGGAPITEAYAQEIGADGYAPDAGRAAKMAEQLMATS